MKGETASFSRHTVITNINQKRVVYEDTHTVLIADSFKSGTDGRL